MDRRPFDVNCEPVQAILAGGAPDDASRLLKLFGQPAEMHPIPARVYEDWLGS